MAHFQTAVLMTTATDHLVISSTVVSVKLWTMDNFATLMAAVPSVNRKLQLSCSYSFLMVITILIKSSGD